MTTTLQHGKSRAGELRHGESRSGELQNETLLHDPQPNRSPADVLRDFCRPHSLSLFARQKEHPRFGPIVAQATRLGPEALNGSLLDVFALHVARQGDRIAVESGEQSITYARLDRASTRLARQLWATLPPAHTPNLASNHAQVDPAPVAVIVEKCIDAIVALLAIWKIGRPVMFLEPDIVPAQLADHVRNTQARLILSKRPYTTIVERVAEGNSPHSTAVLYLDDLGTLVDSPHTDEPESGHRTFPIVVGPDSPAIMNQTSGSTGVPKYALQSHRVRLYFAWDIIHIYLQGPGDRVALFHALSSSSAPMIYVPSLVAGSTLCLLDTANVSPQSQIETIDRLELTCISLPTVAMGELLHALEGRNCLPHVRLIQLTGQTIYRREIELFQQKIGPGAVLVARYAMTEVGGMAEYQFDHASKLEWPSAPAGYAYPERYLFVVDDDGQILPPGEMGEIVVCSPLPGYWDMSDVPLSKIHRSRANGDSEHASGPSTLLGFRTGDLGVFLPDGCLIHRGRKDDIVKIRGYRVSLVELENALLDLPGVAKAAARTFPTPGGDNRLIGYVELHSSMRMGWSIQRAYELLRNRIASPAIPARIVVVDPMPMTGSGKPDRKELPMPGNPRPELETPYRAPATELESRLAALWAHTLDLEEVGVDDDFFLLGGDSILMARLLMQVEKEWKRGVWRNFFDAPTIATLAHQLSAKYGSAAPQPQPPASPNVEPEIERKQLSARSTAGMGGRLLERVFSRGPRWRDFHLPYGLGSRLQRVFCSLPAVQAHFAEHLRHLYLWHEVVGDERSRAEAAQNYLMANSWRRWRRLSISHSERTLAHYLRIEGEAALSQLQNPEQGIILVYAHARLRNFHTLIPQLSSRLHALVDIDAGVDVSRRSQPVQNHSVYLARRAQQLVDAHHTLNRGGLVRIAGDGNEGDGGVIVPFWRRHLQLRFGAAELAVNTGARLVPYFVWLEASGHVTIHLEPPIEPEAGSRSAQVQSITRQYGEILARMWPRQYASMGLSYLPYFSRLPPI